MDPTNPCCGSADVTPTAPTPAPERPLPAAHPPHDHHATPAGCGDCCGGHEHAPLRRDAPTAKDLPTFRIDTMDCAVEEAEIRQAVEGLPGLRGLRFALGARQLSIDAEPAALGAALAAIRRAGFKPQAVVDPASGDHEQATAGSRERLKLALALVLALGAEGLGALLPSGTLAPLLGLALALGAILLAGLSVYTKGLSALARGRLNINALMTVAVTGAVLIGQWPEAAMVMTLYAIAEAIEARAVDRARHAIRSLLAMSPEQASVQQADGTWLTTAVAEVPLGATLRVKPGERVPLDGVISLGATSLNQAPITGESLPVDKRTGDPVFAGTVNLSSTFELQVTAPASSSTLARIIQAVEQAQSSRAPVQGMVDRFAAIYTPAVFVLALALGLLGPALLGWTWTQAVYKALVMLVIACPCALVISTPVTLVSALAAAARRGVLIKGGLHLEQARRLRAIAFDKTGTLTEGRPELVNWTAVGTAMAANTASRLAATLASHSDHPVARAIAQGLPAVGDTAEGFTALPGRGVQATLDGATWVLGNQRLIEERGQFTPEVSARLAPLAAAGHSVSLLAGPQGVQAVFAVADTVKPGARDAVARLQALGIEPVMLTGDHTATAQAVAQATGIHRVHGNLLPEHKQAQVQALQQEFGATAMAGDGINDAPALAQADLGFAMGAAGTDTAMETADVVVMNDDLGRVADTVLLSRATHGVLWQNIVLALGIKAVFMALAVFGQASMWMAVFADMGASLLVVFNGLRLLRWRARG